LNKKIVIVVLSVILCCIVFIVQQRTTSEEIKGTVISIDDEEILSSGVSYIGHQILKVKVLEGPFSDDIINVNNLLMGQSDYDEIYKAGDNILMALSVESNQVKDARAISMNRSPWLMLLVGIMAFMLLAYGRWVGFKALVSFLLSIWIIWFVLIKGLVSGLSPILLTTLTVILLSAIIIFLVSGFNRRGLAAFIATISGLLIALIITHIFGSKMGLYGMTEPYVQTLVISGYFNLNLLEIFYAAIILGASGAAMDIAVDVSASMYEIMINNPLISRKKLIQSGLNVGRQVIGTMTTTLLLAYSGSYLTLLMLFMVKETTFIRMMNMKIVVSEVLRTIMGSIGLIMVAPLTALIAGTLFTRNKSSPTSGEVELKVSENIN